ncbi:MAG TPA: pyruvate kinase [Tepidisphaeraceae bacterium]|nr:pyruvate kinase [Tepidisphaeraceae bacterium]
MIRTKIVATMGPACSEVETLLKLFEAGVDVCRLNFSHGDLESHLEMLRSIREAAASFSHPIAILGDLCGPKIRVGPVDGNGMAIGVGDHLIIQRQAIIGQNGRISTTLPELVDDVRIGDRVLIEDGLLRFVCVEKNFNELRCACTAGGILKSAKGLNLPHTPINVPSMTDRDWECVRWAVENDLDYLALSFVRKAADIQLLREHLQNQTSDINIIAKIEKAEAIQEIDTIVDASDALMVARGDLGVEMDVAEVPIIQKDLIRRCQTAGKPVIVATQMLQSMIEQSSPTRAEVSDVANAIFDGTDAVMLSGETSVGKFPLGCAHIMSHIAEITENYINASDTLREPLLRLKILHLSAAMAKGVWQMAHDLKVKLVVIWSQSGLTARIFAKARFPMPIVALSTDHRVLRRMSLHYGVIPHELAPPGSIGDLIARVDELIRRYEYAADGDRIIIVTGASLGTPDVIDGAIVHTVGSTVAVKTDIMPAR